MSDFDTKTLTKYGKEYTYMLTISGRNSDKLVKIEPPLKNVTSVEIVQARVPMTEYTIEYDRNMLSITQEDISGGEINTKNIILPNQDYSPKLISSMINSLLTTDGFDITMSALTTTGKFRMTSEKGPFSILDTTTCHYPIGLRDTETINSVIDISGGTDGADIWYIDFPNRYDLVVSDVILLSSEELDTSINRGRNSDNFLPLAEFFLQSPGMSENYSNMDIPYRHFKPIASLEKLNLNFTRESEHRREVNRVPYNFRGIKWYLKISIKTKEIEGSSEKDLSTVTSAPTPPEHEFISGSTGIRPKEGEMYIPSIGSGSYTAPDTYTFIPMAANSSEYTYT